MALSNISNAGSTQSVTSTQSTQSVEQTKQRLKLNTTSQFEGTVSNKTSVASSGLIEGNNLSDSQANQFNSDAALRGQAEGAIGELTGTSFAYSSATNSYLLRARAQSPDQRQAIEQASRPIANAVHDVVFNKGSSSALTNTAQSQGTVQDIMGQLGLGQTGGQSTEEMLSNVMYQGVTKAEAELGALALQVRNRQELKAEVRSALTDLREAATNLPQTVDVPEFDSNGAISGYKQITYENTPEGKNALDAKVQELDGRIQSISDMNQLDQMMLQDSMQKIQQVYNTLSNILKMMHDTAKSLIGNVRA
jgi:hypothetical protein